MAALNAKQLSTYAFAACAVVVAAYFVFRSDPSQPQIPENMDFVCVQSGETFSFPRKAAIIPMKHPVTGERTLVPYMKDESGKLVIITRYREAVTNLAEKNKYVDPDTFEIRDAPNP